MVVQKQSTLGAPEWTITPKQRIKISEGGILRDIERMKIGQIQSKREHYQDIFCGETPLQDEQTSLLLKNDLDILKIQCVYIILCIVYIIGWICLLLSVF